MNYSHEPKPAKIQNLQGLEDLIENIYLKRNPDKRYFSTKKPENNTKRLVFTLETSDVNISSTVRLVNCIIKNNKIPYRSFVIEPKDKSTGISIISLDSDHNKILNCTVRMIPLNTLSDIAEVEADSKLLTVNLEKASFVIETDFTISLSNTDEAIFYPHEVDINSISNLVTQDDLVQLKRELEYQGNRIIAHYFQDVMNLFIDDNDQDSKFFLPHSEQILELPENPLKKVLLANALSGCIIIEIIGQNSIRDLKSDWTSASAFIWHLI